MSNNETSNRSHAGLVLQTFGILGLPPIITAAWGIDVATLQKFAVGFYVVRLTQSCSLTVDLAGGSNQARFDCLVTAQGLALPDFVTGFIQPDPFAGAVPGPGGEIQFPWLGVQTVNAAGTHQDIDAVINLEVRRIPRRGL